MTRQTKPVPMCCVTIGYQDFLMPATAGMRFVELMRGAVFCNKGFGGSHYTYEMGEEPVVRYESVKPSQVVMPKRDHEGADTLLAISHTPLKIGG
jgi:hypothetical protein